MLKLEKSEPREAIFARRANRQVALPSSFGLVPAEVAEVVVVVVVAEEVKSEQTEADRLLSKLVVPEEEDISGEEEEEEDEVKVAIFRAVVIE